MRGVCLCLALLGCDAYTQKNGDDAPFADAAVSGDAAAEGCVDQRAGYPDGPYGTGEGDVIANLAFTGADGAPLDLASLHAPCGQRLLLVSTSAGWCTACREEQPKLQSLYDDLRADGLVVMVAYFEDDNYEPGTVDLAADWRERYGLSFPVVVDAAFALGDYYDRALTPMSMLVDLETMRIVKVMTGYDDSLVRSLLGARL
jgi:hypothetical protein